MQFLIGMVVDIQLSSSLKLIYLSLNCFVLSLGGFIIKASIYGVIFIFIKPGILFKQTLDKTFDLS